METLRNFALITGLLLSSFVSAASKPSYDGHYCDFHKPFAANFNLVWLGFHDLIREDSITNRELVSKLPSDASIFLRKWNEPHNSESRLSRVTKWNRDHPEQKFLLDTTHCKGCEWDYKYLNQILTFNFNSQHTDSHSQYWLLKLFCCQMSNYTYHDPDVLGKKFKEGMWRLRGEGRFNTFIPSTMVENYTKEYSEIPHSILAPRGLISRLDPWRLILRSAPRRLRYKPRFVLARYAEANFGSDETMALAVRGTYSFPDVVADFDITSTTNTGGAVKSQESQSLREPKLKEYPPKSNSGIRFHNGFLKSALNVLNSRVNDELLEKAGPGWDSLRVQDVKRGLRGLELSELRESEIADSSSLNPSKIENSVKVKHLFLYQLLVLKKPLLLTGHSFGAAVSGVISFVLMTEINSLKRSTNKALLHRALSFDPKLLQVHTFSSPPVLCPHSQLPFFELMYGVKREIMVHPFDLAPKASLEPWVSWHTSAEYGSIQIIQPSYLSGSLRFRHLIPSLPSSSPLKVRSLKEHLQLNGGLELSTVLPFGLAWKLWHHRLNEILDFVQEITKVTYEQNSKGVWQRV